MFYKIFLMCLAIWLSITSFSCLAVYEPPVNRSTSFRAEFDKNSLPTSLIIWNALSGGQDDSDGQKWGRNTLNCLSTTDTTYGSCAIRPAWMNPGGGDRADVKLNFRLQGGSNQVILNIKPMHTITFFKGGTSDAGLPCEGNTHTTYASLAFGCYNSKVVTNEFTYSIPQSELAKLSPPGTWTATLKQNLRSWSASGGEYLNTWSADISLTVSDIKSQQIYFPTFPYSNPEVNLNLTNYPGSHNNIITGGSSSLDMCLYDGKNSKSTQINMIFKDEGDIAPGRLRGYFSVYLTGADKSKMENRIDYNLSVFNPTSGQSDMVDNGAEFVWKNTDSRRIQRQVVIPGVPGVSLCVPAPLTFTTPKFRLADKTAGTYKGKLTVIYTPSTQSNTNN